VNEAWEELGNFTVTDPNGSTTSMALWQELSADGSPLPGYRLELWRHRNTSTLRALFFSAEAMHELHSLIGKAMGDKTADNLRAT
jgi:hypothetical protein